MGAAASPFLPVFFPPPRPVIVGMLFGPNHVTACLAVDGGRGGGSCSVCLCLMYGPQALKAPFVSTDGRYGIPLAASSL